MIVVWSVTPARDFQDIEAKFRLDVRERIFFIGDRVAVFSLQFGIEDGNGAIRANAVSVVISRIMGERTQRESVPIQILGITQKRKDEVCAANVVRLIAEEVISMRVIAEVLDNGAAVGVPVGFLELLVRCVGKAL